MKHLTSREPIWIAACLFFVLAATWCFAREFHVPDPDLGIVSISDALSRTQPGDVVRISEGRYSESLTITTSSLTLIGEGNVFIEAGTEEIAPGEFVSPPPFQLEGAENIHLINLMIRGGTQYCHEVYSQSADDSNDDGIRPALPIAPIRVICSDPTEAIIATTSSLTLEDCHVWLFQTNPLPAIRAVNSTLLICDSLIEGPSGYGNGYYSNCYPGGDGGDGLVLVRSCCTLTTSVITGGEGQTGGEWIETLFIPGPGGDGGNGVSMSDNSCIQLEDCSVTGGDGGDARIYDLTPPPYPGGSGGDGIHATDGSLVQTAGTVIAGGIEGLSANTPFTDPVEPGTPGEPIHLESGSVSLEIPSREDQIQLIVKRGPPFPSDADQTDLNSDGFLDVADILARFRFCAR